MLKPIDQTLKVATLVCPGVFLPDVVDAHAAFSMSPNVETHLVWKTLEPFNGMPNWPMAATTTFDECPDVDVLIVGAISPEVIADPEVIAFFKQKAKHATVTIGICFGVLMLGAAGLLEGRRATTNFQLGESLKDFGAIPVSGGRVVVDGNLYTAGPAHGCFEAALIALAALRGEDIAKMIELTLEYNPHPPFKVGSPELAGPDLMKKSLDSFQEITNIYLETARTAYQINRTGADVLRLS